MKGVMACPQFSHSLISYWKLEPSSCKRSAARVLFLLSLSIGRASIRYEQELSDLSCCFLFASRTVIVKLCCSKLQKFLLVVVKNSRSALLPCHFCSVFGQHSASCLGLRGVRVTSSHIIFLFVLSQQLSMCSLLVCFSEFEALKFLSY